MALIQVDPSVEHFHTILEIGTPLLLAFLSYVGLFITNQLKDIKLEQKDAKAELVLHQTEIKEELNRKHAENTQSIAVHQAEDLQKFEAISRTLTRIDGKLDRIEMNGAHR